VADLAELWRLASLTLLEEGFGKILDRTGSNSPANSASSAKLNQKFRIVFAQN
jgi:hypothetical protein